jgi:tRNA(fMet)-specific endonuclease VapC
MLDTNVLSALMKNPDGTVAKRIESVGERSICCSIVVAAELRYGAEKKQSIALHRRVETILSAIPVLPLATSVDKYYASIRAELTRQGTPIGPNDLWIAAHALSEQMSLVTANLKEFQRVRSLSVESWE